MQIYVYRVADSHGGCVEGVVKDLSDTLFLSGLRDTAGQNETFESEAHHVWSWAEEHGFNIERFAVTLDLDRLTTAGWEVQGNNYGK